MHGYFHGPLSDSVDSNDAAHSCINKNNYLLNSACLMACTRLLNSIEAGYDTYLFCAHTNVVLQLGHCAKACNARGAMTF